MSRLSALSSKVKFYRIIFLQREDDFDGFDGGADCFFEADTSAQLAFLEQWYQDSNEHYDSHDYSSSGNTDNVSLIIKDGITYILSVNKCYRYAGLQVREGG